MGLAQDLRIAFRQLRSNPGFTAAALLSLALGIGATTSIFSLGNGLLNKRIEVDQPEGLVRVYRNAHSPLPWEDLRELRMGALTLSGLAGEQPIGVGLGFGEGTERARAALVTGDFFTTLGVEAAVGGVFSYAPDREETAPAVAVLSHAYWQSRFGGDSTVVGRTIRINDRPFTVLGVSERGFLSSQLIWRPALFVPVGQVGALLGTTLEEWGGTLYATGRLAPGASVAEANAELDVLRARMRRPRAAPEESATVRVEEARGIAAEARGPLTAGLALMLAMVGLVLLIACANVANLLLARAVARRREIAARMALGASRGRLVRQLLTESLVLAVMGAGLGYGLAELSTPLLPRLLPPALPVAFDPTPDTTVLLFGLAVAVLTGLVFGIVPAWQASAPDLVPALKEEQDGTAFGSSRLRGALVAAQVTLCVVSIATAGLFVRSLANGRAMDPGFDASGVLDVPLYLEAARQDAEAGARFFVELAARLEARPAIRSAAIARLVPLSGSNSGGALIRHGIDEARPRDAPATYKNEVGPGYFEMLGIRVLRGRSFTREDGPGAPPVLILNATAAARLWPGENPIGRRVALDDPGALFREVVGIVEDTKYLAPDEAPQTFAYLPLLQRYRTEVVLHVRGADGPASATAAIREVLADADPRIAVGDIRTMAEDTRVSLVPARAGALLLGTFGLLALVIAAVGISGVTSYVVSRRTREIGIRTSLGARGSDVLRLMMGGTLRRVALGIAIGVAVAIGAGRLLSGFLYGVSPFDPVSTLITPLILVAVALLATYVPARRSTRVDPVEALRHE